MIEQTTIEIEIHDIFFSFIFVLSRYFRFLFLSFVQFIIIKLHQLWRNHERPIYARRSQQQKKKKNIAEVKWHCACWPIKIDRICFFSGCDLINSFFFLSFSVLTSLCTVNWIVEMKMKIIAETILCFLAPSFANHVYYVCTVFSLSLSLSLWLSSKWRWHRFPSNLASSSIWYPSFYPHVSEEKTKNRSEMKWSKRTVKEKKTPETNER